MLIRPSYRGRPAWLVPAVMLAALLLSPGPVRGGDAVAAQAQAQQAQAQQAQAHDEAREAASQQQEAQEEKAQEAGTEPLAPALVATLADLGSDDYATRVNATAELLADNALDVDALVALYARAETVEQRHRLLDIARHHAIRQTREQVFEHANARGSIGVNYDAEPVPAGAAPGLEASAIRIVRPLPGFPAYAHLRAGDLIVAINGQPAVRQGRTEAFTRVIQEHRRGDTITLTLHRDGRLIERPIQLASRQALDSVYEHIPGQDKPRLGHPFRERWAAAQARLRANGPDPQPLRVRMPEPDAEDAREDGSEAGGEDAG